MSDSDYIIYTEANGLRLYWSGKKWTAKLARAKRYFNCSCAGADMMKTPQVRRAFENPDEKTCITREDRLCSLPAL